MSHTLTLSTADPVVSRAKSLLDRLFSPPRAFGLQLWDRTELLAARLAITLVIHPAGALRRMFSPPVELSLGEAFIYGDFDIEGDIFAAFSLIVDIIARAFSPRDIAAFARDMLTLPQPSPRRLDGRRAAQLQGRCIRGSATAPRFNITTMWATTSTRCGSEKRIHRHERARHGHHLHERSGVGQLDDGRRSAGLRLAPWPERTRRRTPHGDDAERS